jgi:hypothetical protein
LMWPGELWHFRFIFILNIRQSLQDFCLVFLAWSPWPFWLFSAVERWHDDYFPKTVNVLRNLCCLIFDDWRSAQKRLIRWAADDWSKINQSLNVSNIPFLFVRFRLDSTAALVLGFIQENHLFYVYYLEQSIFIWVLIVLDKGRNSDSKAFISQALYLISWLDSR